jgi:hypothetical protein
MPMPDRAGLNLNLSHMKHAVILAFLMSLFSCARCQDIITDHREPSSFPIVASTGATAIYVEEGDHWLVQKAAALLQEDIRKVTGREPEIIHVLPKSAQGLIIIGSLDKSSLVARLAAEHKIAHDSLEGKWEAFSLQVIPSPAKGIGRALVIAGSDRRGTAYGIFELSQQIGVSPWYWWADVPVKRWHRHGDVPS